MADAFDHEFKNFQGMVEELKRKIGKATLEASSSHPEQKELHEMRLVQLREMADELRELVQDILKIDSLGEDYRHQHTKLVNILDQFLPAAKKEMENTQPQFVNEE